MEDGSEKAVQNLRVGDRMLGYDTEAGIFTTAVVTQLKRVDTNNMLVIRTETGMPLRVDANPAQTLWAKKADGSVGWLSVTELEIGDFLFYNEARWVQITGIEFAPEGRHVMFDIISTSPYFANGYLDPQQKSPSRSPLGSMKVEGTCTGCVGATYTVSYTYNGEVLERITYPTTFSVKYAYDDLGRVLSATAYGTSPTYAKFSYFENDQVRGVEYGNGLIANYTYDSVSRPKSIKLLKPGETTPTLLSLFYQYRKTGTVLSISGIIDTVSANEQYDYDSLQRLTSATLTKGTSTTTASYQYDETGNRVNAGLNNEVTSYLYNPGNNELTWYQTVGPTGPVKTVSNGYDSNGNLNSMLVTGLDAANWAYTWDLTGSLTKVTKGSVKQGAYAYDGIGRRVESLEGSTTTFYSYLGTETLHEQVYGGGYTFYIYAGGMRIAKISDYVSYYHSDHLGSTRLVTDDSRTVKVLFSDSYRPFGQDNGTPDCFQSGCSEKHKFTGKPVSQSTGLYYNYQRWYDPSIGRFISEDPVAGDASNKYAYVLNNPLRYVDPDGASPVDALLKGLVAGLVVLYEGQELRPLDLKFPRLGIGIKTLLVDNKTGSVHKLLQIRELSTPKDLPILSIDLPATIPRHAAEENVHLSSRWGHLPLPKGVASAIRNPAKLAGRGLTVLALGLSALNIHSAYQEDAKRGDYSNTAVTIAKEAGGWAGAIVGCEIGGAIGSVVPGPGTAVGCIGGGIIGGIFGEEAVEYSAELLMHPPSYGFLKDYVIPLRYTGRAGEIMGYI